LSLIVSLNHDPKRHKAILLAKAGPELPLGQAVVLTPPDQERCADKNRNPIQEMDRDLKTKAADQFGACIRPSL
jgi:hypothetical protein